MAFSPDTGLAYIPGRDVPGYYDDRDIDLDRWTSTPEDPRAVLGGPSDPSADGEGDIPVDGGTRVTESFDWSTSISPRFIEMAGYPERHKANLAKTLERLEEVVAARHG